MDERSLRHCRSSFSEHIGLWFALVARSKSRDGRQTTSCYFSSSPSLDDPSIGEGFIPSCPRPDDGAPALCGAFLTGRNLVHEVTYQQNYNVSLDFYFEKPVCKKCKSHSGLRMKGGVRKVLSLIALARALNITCLAWSEESLSSRQNSLDGEKALI